MKHLNNINADQALSDARLGLLFKDPDSIKSPVGEVPDFLANQPELYYSYLLSRPEYFGTTCEYLFNIKLHPMQAMIIRLMWYKKFPMLVGSRGFGKSFMLAIYALLRLLFVPNRKIVICGAGFRQSKIIFGYIENIIRNSPILRNMIPEENIVHQNDLWKIVLGNSHIIAIPVGTGDKIRGLRANDIIADEFASINPEIFEVVIAGFAAVSAAPTDNAARIEQDKLAKFLKKNNFNIKIEKSYDSTISNQLILSGTADYSFNHFSKYHDQYRNFIKSTGDEDELSEAFKKLSPRDFAVIRIPVSLIPPGFMDDSQVARAKAMNNTGVYEREYEAVFSKDSTGFFKRSVIESCVVKQNVDIMQSDGTVLKFGDIFFKPMLTGDPAKEYIMGVDPAMSLDNFSIVIIEINSTFRRIAYCWTTNKKDHKEKLELGVTNENNYYTYCARKIRSLMTRFNISYIAIDTAGGGTSVIESINDQNVLEPGEIKILPIIDPEKPKDEDMQEGLHIIDLISFSKETWTAEANHGLRKDLEDKVLLFPFFDAISFAEAEFQNYTADREDNPLRVTSEIEEMKNELCIIVVTQTPTSGRERWDTPEIKLVNGKKGYLRKDRYSALLMANMTARTLQRKITYDISSVLGVGGPSSHHKLDTDGRLFTAGSPDLMAQLETLYRNY